MHPKNIAWYIYGNFADIFDWLENWVSIHGMALSNYSLECTDYLPAGERPRGEGGGRGLGEEPVTLHFPTALESFLFALS